MIKSLVIFLLVTCLHAASLPKYIVPCRRSDPNLNKCVVEHGKTAIQSIVKGDKKIGIPNMLPLFIPQIVVNSGDNLKILVKDAYIYGLEDTIIKDAKIDLEKRHIAISVHIERANLQSQYNINGRILILPITGEGPANITFSGGDYTFDFDFVHQEKRGKTYLKISKSGVKYTTKRSYFRLDNLFGGDKRLGNQMNLFLDENWQEIEKDIGPAFTEAMAAIVNSVFSSLFNKFSYDELFLP